MNLVDIVDAIREHNIRITDHADEEAQSDHLSYDEIYYSVRNGHLIEHYPSDKPYPSCLIFGRNHKGEPIHTVWAYNNTSKHAVLITVYRPDPNLWIDYKQRRKKS
jgi:hypothetical protein